MTVAELIASLSGLDGTRLVYVTTSYATGDAAPVVGVGDEGSDEVYLFPALADYPG